MKAGKIIKLIIISSILAGTLSLLGCSKDKPKLNQDGTVKLETFSMSVTSDKNTEQQRLDIFRENIFNLVKYYASQVEGAEIEKKKDFDFAGANSQQYKVKVNGIKVIDVIINTDISDGFRIAWDFPSKTYGEVEPFIKTEITYKGKDALGYDVLGDFYNDCFREIKKTLKSTALTYDQVYDSFMSEEEIDLRDGLGLYEMQTLNHGAVIFKYNPTIR